MTLLNKGLFLDTLLLRILFIIPKRELVLLLIVNYWKPFLINNLVTLYTELHCRLCYYDDIRELFAP